MSFSHVIRRVVVTSAGNVGGDETVTAGAENNISEAIPANQTNLPVAFSFANGKIKSIVISSDVAMTVCTNAVSGSSPQETIHVVAGKPFIWSLAGSYIGSAASPFGGDVTALYVTNTTAGTLDIRSIVDPT